MNYELFIKNSYYGVTFFFNSHSLLIIIAKFIRL